MWLRISTNIPLILLRTAHQCICFFLQGSIVGKKIVRVYGSTFQTDLVVQMRMCRSAGASQKTDLLAANDPITRIHILSVKMGVESSDSITMIHADYLAIRGTSRNLANNTISCCIDRNAGTMCDIDSRVHFD